MIEIRSESFRKLKIQGIDLTERELTAADGEFDCAEFFAAADVTIVLGIKHPSVPSVYKFVRKCVPVWSIKDYPAFADFDYKGFHVEQLTEAILPGRADVIIVMKQSIFLDFPTVKKTEMSRAYKHPELLSVQLYAPCIKLVGAHAHGSRQIAGIDNYLRTAGAPVIAFTNAKINGAGYKRQGNLLWHGIDVTDISTRNVLGVTCTSAVMKAMNCGLVEHHQDNMFTLFGIDWSIRH